MNLTGEPSSRAAKSLVVSPFCAGCRYMAPDGRAVDAVARVVCHRLGQGHRDHCPDARVLQAPEALAYGHPVSVFLWHITPRAPRAYPLENAVDDGLIIRRWAAFPATTRRQRFFNMRHSASLRLPRLKTACPPRRILEARSDPGVKKCVIRTYANCCRHLAIHSLGGAPAG